MILLLGVNEKQGCKEIIVSILSQKWPLAAKEIYNILKRQVAVTYQAVHKSLNELVSSRVVARKGKRYCLNPDFVVKMKKHWSAIEESYKESSASKIGVFAGKKVLTPTAVYSFEPTQLMVELIPSVFISKSTLQDFVEAPSRQVLQKIAKRVALKDKNYILENMATKQEIKQNPLLPLEKLNELANEYYWGKVSYKTKGSLVEVKINSDVYTSKKGKFFYGKIYEHFMELSGYKLVKRNELETTTIYKKACQA